MEEHRMAKKNETYLVAGELGSRTDSVDPDVRKQFPNEAEGLGAWKSPDGLVGVAEGVNDESAKPVPDFTTTRYELGVLARHYLNEAYERAHWWERSEPVGSDETRMKTFAWRRAGAIYAILGGDTYKKVVSEIREHWERKSTRLATLPRCSLCGIKHDPELVEDQCFCKRNLVIKWSDCTSRWNECPCCGVPTREHVGLDVYLEGTWSPVCESCAAERAPELVKLILGTREVGRIDQGQGPEADE
jgi:hypothetical protein